MLFFWGLGEMFLMKEAQEDLLERQRDVVVAFAGSIKACKGIIVSNDETFEAPPEPKIVLLRFTIPVYTSITLWSPTI